MRMVGVADILFKEYKLIRIYLSFSLISLSIRLGFLVSIRILTYFLILLL
jgi:hypothetical protein